MSNKPADSLKTHIDRLMAQLDEVIKITPDIENVVRAATLFIDRLDNNQPHGDAINMLRDMVHNYHETVEQIQNERKASKENSNILPFNQD